MRISVTLAAGLFATLLCACGGDAGPQQYAVRQPKQDDERTYQFSEFDANGSELGGSIYTLSYTAVNANGWTEIQTADAASGVYKIERLDINRIYSYTFPHSDNNFSCTEDTPREKEAVIAFIGATWTRKAKLRCDDGATVDYDLTGSVVAEERVTINGISYDTLKQVVITKSEIAPPQDMSNAEGPSISSTTTTSWIEPRLGLLVKSTAKHEGKLSSGGRDPDTTTTILVSYVNK